MAAMRIIHFRPDRAADIILAAGSSLPPRHRPAARPAGAFSINPVWDEMIAAGGLYGTAHDGGWCDVGRPESIALAEAMLHSGRDV